MKLTIKQLKQIIKEELAEMKLPFGEPSYWDEDGKFLDPDANLRRKKAGIDQETIDKLERLDQDDPQAAWELADLLGSKEEEPLDWDAFDPRTEEPLPDDFYDPRWDEPSEEDDDEL